MSKDAIATYLRGKSAEAIFSAYDAGFMLRWPRLFADGHVLPAETGAREVFGRAGGFVTVPVILVLLRYVSDAFQADPTAAIRTGAGPGEQHELDLTARPWQGPPRSFFWYVALQVSGTRGPAWLMSRGDASQPTRVLRSDRVRVPL
jgi:hypothetical protein